jgi:hypothetical protein
VIFLKKIINFGKCLSRNERQNVPFEVNVDKHWEIGHEWSEEFEPEIV